MRKSDNISAQEHARSRASVGGYLAPALVVLFTIFWCLLIYALIGWRTRDWEYGAVPYVPAESAFTTQSYSTRTAPRQVILPAPEPGGQHAEH